MKNHLFVIICVLLVSCCVSAQSAVKELSRQLPDDTIGYIATSGTDHFEDEFKKTPLGQICNDAGVQDFFNQIISSFSQQENFAVQGIDKKLKTLLGELFTSPAILGFSVDPEDDAANPFSVYLVCKDSTGQGKLKSLFEEFIKEDFKQQTVVCKELQGHSVYVCNDPNQVEVVYAGQIGRYFIGAFNDADYKLLTHLAQKKINSELSHSLSQVASSRDAVVGFLDFKRILSMTKQEISETPADKQFWDAIDQLGLTELNSLLCNAGFEDGNLVADIKLRVPTHQGIWKAIQPIDHKLLSQADAKSTAPGIVHFDIPMLYDDIVSIIDQSMTDPNHRPQDQIAMFEEKLGFNIRKQLLGSLEGSYMGYSLPSYSLPQLPGGGYVVTAKLTDSKTMQDCLQKLGDFIATQSGGQMQVSSQKTAAGKQVHIWAVGLLAMMQYIPSWGIQGDTLVIASHPILTGQVLDQVESGNIQKSIISQSEMKQLLDTAPADAFAITLVDSKAQARQLMLMLQQFWPAARMMMSNQGLRLPIMLPSVDSYIEKMKPGISYGRKTPSGLEWYYQGSGLEISSGSATGTAMGLAIVMPALNKVKKTAQNKVSEINLKEIGIACMNYANDHKGYFPFDFDELVDDYNLPAKSLESPRKPKNFNGPSYIMVSLLTDKAPPNIILAYENPEFCEDMVNILYVDGHVASVKKVAFEKELEETENYCGWAIEQEMLEDEEFFNSLGKSKKDVKNIMKHKKNNFRKASKRPTTKTILNKIGFACKDYAYDHKGKLPNKLDVLVAEYNVPSESLQSFRKPDGSEGSVYILIPGLTDEAPWNIIAAHRNPDFCYGKVDVLYVDGHIERMEKSKLKQELEKTGQYLGRQFRWNSLEDEKLSNKSEKFDSKPKQEVWMLAD